MTETPNKQLLRNKNVLEEIGRHQWIESEKAGQDIGFDKAATDWLARFSQDWVKYHMPEQKNPFENKNEATKASKASKGRVTAAKKKTIKKR